MMRSTAIRRLAVLVVVLAALGAVAVAAYNFGVGRGPASTSIRGMTFRGPGLGLGYRLGYGVFGLLGFVLIGLLLFWLLAALLSPDRGSNRPAPPAGGDVDRLRELSEMRSRGELTDEEFTAAKRKFLGLQ